MFLGQIEGGLDPRASEGLVTTTLAAAWERFGRRTDLRPGTLAMYQALYKRCLLPWAHMPLATLSAQPMLAEDLHTKLTQEHGPSEANHALRLLRTIFREAARRDRSLIRDQHPCTSVKWNPEKPAAEEKAIPLNFLPTWVQQVEMLRERSPTRASFAMLNLRLGTRPGELARAKWTDIERGVLVLPETKTHLVEVPLTPQIVAEFERVREVDQAQYPTNPYIFPARAGAHLRRLTEAKEVLSHSGSSGRTTHHTIGVTLGIDDRVLDVLEGRTLAKSGAAAAGRGYISRKDLVLCSHPTTSSGTLVTAKFSNEIGLLRVLARNLVSKPSPYGPVTQELLRTEGLARARRRGDGLVAIQRPGHEAFNELAERIIGQFPTMERGTIFANFQTELLDFLATTHLERDPALIGAADVSACVSAWNKDPVFGVIGIQSGPRGLRVHTGFHDYGSRGWDADCGDDCEDPPRVFCTGQVDQGDLS